MLGSLTSSDTFETSLTPFAGILVVLGENKETDFPFDNDFPCTNQGSGRWWFDLSVAVHFELFWSFGATLNFLKDFSLFVQFVTVCVGDIIQYVLDLL